MFRSFQFACCEQGLTRRLWLQPINVDVASTTDRAFVKQTIRLYTSGCKTREMAPARLVCAELGWAYGSTLFPHHSVFCGTGVTGQSKHAREVRHYSPVTNAPRGHMPDARTNLSTPSPPQSFIPGLKPSFSANPFHRSLSFLLQD